MSPGTAIDLCTHMKKPSTPGVAAARLPMLAVWPSTT